MFIITKSYFENSNVSLYQCDNMELLKQLPSNHVQLIYSDILYNTGKTFDDFNDKLGTTENAIEWYLPRITEMKRILKDTGNIFIHCDWHLSHYLKVLMDKVFGEDNFRNEIIWVRSNDTGSSKAKAKRLPVCTDTILFYSKSNEYYFKMPTVPYDEKLMSRYKYDDNDGKGKYYWADLRTYSQKRLEELTSKNEVKQRSSGKYSYKRYLNDSITEKALPNIWDDINRLNTTGNEYLGYNTQKPVSLLERIITIGSQEHDLVADFFMGSGTTGDVALKLNRKFIGCDISEKACIISKNRLNTAS